jgi:hypothetical protein
VWRGSGGSGIKSRPNGAKGSGAAAFGLVAPEFSTNSVQAAAMTQPPTATRITLVCSRLSLFTPHIQTKGSGQHVAVHLTFDPAGE